MRYQQPYGLPDYGAGEGQPYINGDPTIGQEGSIPPAAAFEFPQREIINLIKKTGFVPDDGDLLQVTRGVRQGANYAVATFIPGNNNDLSITLDPPLDTYRAGLCLRVKTPVTNTGAASLNVNGLGNRSIRRANGAVCSAGDLQAGAVVDLVDDGTFFQIVNFQGFTSDTTNNNTYVVNIPYGVDVGSANAVVAPFAPAISSLTPGLMVLCKIGNANTGPTTITCNGLATVPLIRVDLKPLAPNDIIPGMIIGAVFDGTQFQMITVPATQPRVLTAPMSYYVNIATGTDAPGYGLTAGMPFRTIQYATYEMVKWTNLGQAFSIYVADGTYDPFGCPEINGSGTCVIIGNVNAPQNCLVYDHVNSAPNTECIHVIGRNYTIAGFKLQSDHGYGLISAEGATVRYYNMDFGYCQQGHVMLWLNATATQWSAGVSGAFINISGSAAFHQCCNTGSRIDCEADVWPFIALNFINSVSFNQFAIAADGGSIADTYRQIANANYCTGQKYAATGNGVINTMGAGPNYLPGNQPGYTATGGQYL